MRLPETIYQIKGYKARQVDLLRAPGNRNFANIKSLAVYLLTVTGNKLATADRPAGIRERKDES